MRAGRRRRLRPLPLRRRGEWLTLSAFVEQGDHVLMTNTAYEPSQDFCTKILAKLGVTTSWFDPLIGADIARLVRPETRVVFLESPGSITMEVHDVPAIVAAVRQVAPEAIIMIDNTWRRGSCLKPRFWH